MPDKIDLFRPLLVPLLGDNTYPEWGLNNTLLRLLLLSSSLKKNLPDFLAGYKISCEEEGDISRF
jgi:hypothetical protein